MSEHLKQALRPFAEAANKWEPTVSDSYPIQGTDPVYCDLTVGDLRRAAELYDRLSKGPDTRDHQTERDSDIAPLPVRETSLVACPFCGGKAKVWARGEVWYVECVSCRANTAKCNTQEGAVNSWNRPALAMQPPRPPKPVCSVWKSLAKNGNCRDCGHPKEAHSHDSNS